MHSILIVEDDRILRKRIVKAILRISSAVTVKEVSDSDAALAFLGKQPVDLVITDIRLPKGSGLLVIAYLNAFLPEIPCFVMTAYGTSRLRDKMPRDLLNFYDKPFDVESFAVAAVAALKRRRGADFCSGIQLPNFVHMAAADGATATISVTHPEHAPCELYLKNGELIDAVSEHDRGEAVAIEAMAWDNPDYSLAFGIPDDCKRTIQTPVTNLLRIACECFDDSV